MTLNEPAVVAEVSAAFYAYEAALMGDDLDAMQALFWASPLTVRYGVGENLYGIEAIAAFRTARRGSPQRTLTKVTITTFGADFATVNAEFQRVGEPRPGRQSQAWARMGEGWRVVSAHVSLINTIS